MAVGASVGATMGSVVGAVVGGAVGAALGALVGANLLTVMGFGSRCCNGCNSEGFSRHSYECRDA
jgi:uncharacterized protein YcfJ